MAISMLPDPVPVFSPGELSRWRQKWSRICHNAKLLCTTEDGPQQMLVNGLKHM